MFGGDDPFGMFGHMRRQMDMMDRMMESMMDPFMMMGGGRRRPTPFDMLEGPQPQDLRVRQVAQMDPFGLNGFGMLRGFGGIGQMMNQMQDAAMNNPNSHMYCHSTVMSFGPDGQRHIVEETTNKAGDVRETRRRVRDNEREEMSIGHSIGDRTHIIEKKRDKDGNVRSQQRFVNLDEDEAVDFDREYQSRARRNVYGGGRSSSNRHALEDTGSSNRRERYGSNSSSAPIITLPEEDEEPQGESTTQRIGGPIIREISEEEAEQSIPKRRKDNKGRSFFTGN